MRWRAIVTYEDGSTAEHEFEEFADFGDWLERGPDWNEIQVIYLRKRSAS